MKTDQRRPVEGGPNAAAGENARVATKKKLLADFFNGFESFNVRVCVVAITAVGGGGGGACTSNFSQTLRREAGGGFR